jgi:hypothetical protein
MIDENDVERIAEAVVRKLLNPATAVLKNMTDKIIGNHPEFKTKHEKLLERIAEKLGVN